MTDIPMTDIASNVAGLAVGVVTEDWTSDARFLEYGSAVDPLAAGAITAVPLRRFPAPSTPGPTREVVLDLSDALGTPYAATGPALLARFVCLAPGASMAVSPAATSTLVYCLEGRGTTEVDHQGRRRPLSWQAGDVVTIPGGTSALHRADHLDAGRAPCSTRWTTRPCSPTWGWRWSSPASRPPASTEPKPGARLDAVATAPGAASASRVAVLLANARNDQTLTATHTLWAMLGVLPAGQVQRPHRHQSIALDLIVGCRPGCYTLVGAEIGARRHHRGPGRVDWEPGGAFVTPPGLWHSHHNESGAPANLLPVQDAGLHTYLRTLDIRFTGP